MKRWPLGFLLVIAMSAHAQSFWDGNAAVQRGDAAFDAGAFALSSAFARDTEIVVEDPATGKTTTAKVVGRVDDRLDILVLLSPAAAAPLGLEVGEVVHVRVTVRKTLAGVEPIIAEETAPSADPDRIAPPVSTVAEATETAAEVAQAVKTGTPAVTSEAAVTVKESLPAESVTPAAEEAVAEEPVVEEAVAEEPVVEEAVAEEPVVEEAVAEEPVVEEAVAEEPVVEEAVAEEPVVEEAVAEEPVVEEAVAEEPVAEEPVAEEAVVEEPPSPDELLLAELAARSPQKQLHLPPREDELFVYQEPVEAPPVEVVEAPVETPTETPVETVVEPPVETVETPAETPAETVAEAGPEAIESPLASGTAEPTAPGLESLAVAALAEPEIASDPGPEAPGSTAEPLALLEARPPAEIVPELVETLTAEAPEPLPRDETALAEPGLAPAAAEGQPAVTAEVATEPSPAEKPPVTVGATAAVEGTSTTAAATTTTAAAATTTTATTATAEKPPVATAATPPVEVKPVAVVLDLPAKGRLTYYLQLAAYSTEAMAKDTAARLSPTYPVLVLAPPAGSKPLYRVFIGPLNKAESGTLLTLFKQRGFPDAFARVAQN